MVLSDLSPRVVEIRGPVETKPAQEHAAHAVILSIASGVVGFMSIAIAVTSAYWDHADYEQSHDISCVQFAQQMLQVAEEEEPRLASKDAKIEPGSKKSEQDVYALNLFGQFPPDADTDLADDLFLDSSNLGSDTLTTIKGYQPSGADYTPSGCHS